MTWNRRMIGIGVGIAAATFVVAATDAEARVHRLRPRHAPRHRHRFKSAPAPGRAKTPALDSNGAADTSSLAPVAGGAVEGSFRQDVVDGGTLLAMSPSRALVLNAYRGLLLVDTTDPTTPRTLASVAVDGTGERMLLGVDEVAIVSDARDSTGARTLVTSVAIGASSLTVRGVARVAGSLRDVAREHDDLLLVTSDSYVGPNIYMTPAGTGKPGPMTASGGAPDGSNAPYKKSMRAGNTPSGMVYPWYGGGQSRVARVRIGADGSPSVLGAVEVDGDVLSDSITGNDAVLVVQSGGGWVALPPGDPRGPNSGADGSWTPPMVSLARYQDDAAGAPALAGKLDLANITGVAALDRDGVTLRALEYGDAGEIVATFDLSGGTPVALGSLALGEWPSAFAFAGGAFVYGTTTWQYDTTLPSDPVFDPAGVADAFNGGTKGGGAAATPGVTTGPTSALHSVDLRNPAKPAAGSSVDLGGGWLNGFTAAPGGVVGTLYDYSADNGSTSVFRVDVSDPETPSLTGNITLSGYSNLGQALGDVLLVDGGSSDSNGSFRPSTRLIDLSGNGLTLGGSFSAPSWTSSAARDGDLLGLASYDRLTLVDVSDRSKPQVGGDVRLVVNVAGFAALDGSTGAVLATDYVGGGVEIRSVSLPAADALAPLDVLKVATGDAQMFAAPPYLYVVATDWSSGRASLTVVDASDPSHLAKRGSLDLAAYPGQVFLKGRALLLLRPAWSLFYETDSGAMKSSSDAFGRCPKAWIRNSLAGVLDVVDLADPDAPEASARLPLDWDASGVAVLSGDSLYVPSYVDVSNSDDGTDAYAYMIQEIDLRNPLRPSARTPQDVPGTLVAATGAPHQVLTTQYAYDVDTGATTTSLQVVDLSLPWKSRVRATTTLDGYPDTVTVGAGHAYAVVESWSDLTMLAGQLRTYSPAPSCRLVAYDLSDLAVTSSTSRDVGAYAGEIHAGYLFLRTWGWTGSIDEYSLAAPDAPAFVASREVAGLAGDLVVVGGRAYAPGGLYGVESFDLSGN